MPSHQLSADPAGAAEAPLIADHLALDLLNTVAGAGALQHDFWQSADDVLCWLQRGGIDAGSFAGDGEKEAWLREAQTLRASARALIAARHRGEREDPAVLNRFLATMASTPALEWHEDGARLVRRGAGPSPGRALGEVAEAVATLLADGDFALVRQCEHADCVLWFYDRTKSHRRRWCSMAVCGNRHKAAEFRKRSRAAGP